MSEIIDVALAEPITTIDVTTPDSTVVVVEAYAYAGQPGADGPPGPQGPEGPAGQDGAAALGDSATNVAPGTAAAGGSALTASRTDHVHGMGTVSGLNGKSDRGQQDLVDAAQPVIVTFTAPTGWRNFNTAWRFAASGWMKAAAGSPVGQMAVLIKAGGTMIAGHRSDNLPAGETRWFNLSGSLWFMSSGLAAVGSICSFTQANFSSGVIGTTTGSQAVGRQSICMGDQMSVPTSVIDVVALWETGIGNGTCAVHHFTLAQSA